MAGQTRGGGMNGPPARDSSGQLPLALELKAPAVFDTFVTMRDSAVIAHLKAASTGSRRELIWLSGAAGTGKTHLLQAACRAADGAGKRAMYLSLAARAELAPALLDDLGRMDMLAIDAVAAAAGDAAWERALFAVLNDFQLGDGSLLLAARAAPAAAGFVMPDLASRAAGAVLYRLRGLTGEAVLDALILHARFRGLELDVPTAQYLLSRVRRGMSELCDCLDHLDRVSLIEQRKLTIPFVRSALATASAE